LKEVGGANLQIRRRLKKEGSSERAGVGGEVIEMAHVLEKKHFNA